MMHSAKPRPLDVCGMNGRRRISASSLNATYDRPRLVRRASPSTRYANNRPDRGRYRIVSLAPMSKQARLRSGDVERFSASATASRIRSSRNGLYNTLRNPS